MTRAREIERVARVHRDPFEPILVVLEAPSPLAEYRKIADEIVRLMPDRRRYPKCAAEALRSLLLIRLGLHLGLRQKNLRQLLLRRRGETSLSERQLIELQRGELRWSERENGWEVFIPAAAFKNAHSSFFGGRPFRLMLPNLAGLYDAIELYVTEARALLLRDAKDPGTFFVKTVKGSSESAAYNQTTFYEAWRLTIQRYGIYNPYTGRGALAPRTAQCARCAGDAYLEADRILRTGELRHPGHTRDRGAALRAISAGEQGLFGSADFEPRVGERLDTIRRIKRT
jgi:hypothetical protein